MKFDIIKDVVTKNLRDNGQFEGMPELEHAIKSSKDFADIKKAIDDYWGWEDEQTVWLLESIIEKL